MDTELMQSQRIHSECKSCRFLSTTLTFFLQFYPASGWPLTLIVLSEFDFALNLAPRRSQRYRVVIRIFKDGDRLLAKQ